MILFKCIPFQMGTSLKGKNVLTPQCFDKMLSNNTFSETRIQRLRDGLNFVEKGLGVHVQRMLKMSRVYTLAEILCKIFVKKKTKGNWRPYLRSWFDKLRIWCQLNFN